MQRIAEEELERGVVAKRAEGGLALILDTRTGDILAAANYPSFDPNKVHLYPKDELSKRRRNRIFESQFEPGSTIKPIWAAGAIEWGVFRRDQVIWEGGRTTRLLGRRVTDVSDHGRMTFEEAVVYSSNIGLAKVGLELGGRRMTELLDRFHFQKKSGVLVPGEARGRRTALENWKPKYTTISASFGFEVSMTPIQLGAAYVSLVNGGRYFAPRLVRRLERGSERYEFPVQELGRSVSEDTSRQMREILRRVVVEGTGRRWQIDGLPFGGKTGTAAISKGRRGYAAGGKDYLSSFIAYAPHPDPQIVIVVMIEKPRGSYYGSTVCGPVVKGCLKRIFRVPEKGPEN